MSYKLICFTSISCDFYRAAYDLYAFQYLIKPVTEQDFKKMLEKAGEKFQEQRTETVLLTYRGKMIHIPCSQILYIESQGHTLLFHLKNGQIEKQNGQLSDYEVMLNSDKFLRTHQSYLVNIKNMDAVDGSHFVCGKTLIPISRKYAHAKEVYRNALFDDMG